MSSLPDSVEDIIKDFKGRRSAIIRALTTDLDQFYESCDPDRENLCLYGYPTGLWEVNIPSVEIPPELPEPSLGINFSRDGMDKEGWVSLVAIHSDCWLLSVAFFHAAGLGANKRKQLYTAINRLQTVFEVVRKYTYPGMPEDDDKSSVESGSNCNGEEKNSDDEKIEDDP